MLRFVSHDLKSAVHGLRLHAGILLDVIDDGTPDDGAILADVRHRLLRMDALKLSMWGLVDELLDVAQLQAGRELTLQRDQVQPARESG